MAAEMAAEMTAGQMAAEMTAGKDVGADAAQFLKLLADPTRRQIFLVVMGGEICNCELAEALGMAENLVSHHIRKLRAAGLVEEHRDPHDGRWSHCTVNVEALAATWAGLEEAFHPSHVGDRAPACRVRARKDTPVGPVAGPESQP